MTSQRTVQLTEAGVRRVSAARRRYGIPIDDIAADRDTPSPNTVKKALRGGAVFVRTLERVWEFIRRRAAERREELPALKEGADFVYVDVAPGESAGASGWLSRAVPPPNRLFTGRGDVLARLHAALTGTPGAPFPDPQALSGLGGIGKTQTALAYVYAYRGAYRRVFWIVAETPRALDDGLLRIADELGLGAGPAERVLGRIHDWFRNESGWLLVLDNADELDALAPHFPPHHGGRILLTTRAADTMRWAARVPLERLSADMGAAMLLRRAGRDDVSADEQAGARSLSDELGGLPLAIHQAGAYLAGSGATIDRYREQYARQGLEWIDSALDRDHAPVAITFRLALERLDPRAADLVRLCAFLAPDAIPELLFVGPEHEAIRSAACSSSLLDRDTQAGALSVHRLVQQATQATLDEGQRGEWARRAIHLVAAATPDFEYDDWPTCERLLPHWRACAQHSQTLGIADTDTAYLLYQAGRYLRVRAHWGESEALLERALALGEAVHGVHHVATADTLDELGCLFRATDRPERAEPLHQRALEIVEGLLGPEHPGVAAKLHNFALFYAERRDLERAEALFLRSLAIRRKHPGKDEVQVAATYTQIAGVYREREEFERAESFYRLALEVYERLLEPDHVDIGTGCNNLGLLLIATGRAAEAEALLVRARAITLDARGPEHPETATILWTLARALASQRRDDEAEALFQQARRIYARHFDPQHIRRVRLERHFAEFCAARVPATS